MTSDFFLPIVITDEYAQYEVSAIVGAGICLTNMKTDDYVYLSITGTHDLICALTAAANYIAKAREVSR